MIEREKAIRELKNMLGTLREDGTAFDVFLATVQASNAIWSNTTCITFLHNMTNEENVKTWMSFYGYTGKGAIERIVNTAKHLLTKYQ